MELNNARNFYLKIKDYFNEEQFSSFYKYIEETWLNLEDDEYTKFDFKLWSYINKFSFSNTRNKVLISESALNKYIFISNNCCESINNLINNFIQANTKVSLDRFETIIKTLFIRVKCNRTNKNQLSEKIIL